MLRISIYVLLDVVRPSKLRNTIGLIWRLCEGFTGYGELEATMIIRNELGKSRSHLCDRVHVSSCQLSSYALSFFSEEGQLRK